MGESIEVVSNGSSAQGYLAAPETGSGPGLVMIQEWWGLTPHIRDLCDRLAAEGFVALAPDLFRGDVTTEPDEAGQLMMGLNLDRAAKDTAGAVHWLQADNRVRGAGVGAVGFGMGGGLALVLATQQPDAVKACVPFYGLIPWESGEPDWSAMSAAVQGHFAAADGFFTPEKAAALEQELQELGKYVEFFQYPGADRGFFNDMQPEVYDLEAASLAWTRTLSFLRAHLG